MFFCYFTLKTQQNLQNNMSYFNICPFYLTKNFNYGINFIAKLKGEMQWQKIIK